MEIIIPIIVIGLIYYLAEKGAKIREIEEKNEPKKAEEQSQFNIQDNIPAIDMSSLVMIVSMTFIFLIVTHSIPSYLSEIIIKENYESYTVSTDKIFAYYILESENRQRANNGYKQPSLCGRFNLKNKITDKNETRYFIIDFENENRTMEINADQAALCLKFGEKENTFGADIDKVSVFTF
jgi:hypothetical protein